MERDSDIRRILDEYEAVRKKMAGVLKGLLQTLTQEALEKNLFGGFIPKALEGVDLDIKEPFLYGGLLEGELTEVGSRTEHIILRGDGKLYRLEVLGKPDKDGNWSYESRLLGGIN